MPVLDPLYLHCMFRAYDDQDPSILMLPKYSAIVHGKFMEFNRNTLLFKTLLKKIMECLTFVKINCRKYHNSNVIEGFNCN